MIPWNFSFVPLLPAKTSYDRGSTNQNRGRFESFWVPVEKNCVVDISFFLRCWLSSDRQSARSIFHVSFDFSVIMLYRDDFFSRLILILSTFVLSGFRYFDNSVGVFESRNFVKQELSVPSKVRFKYFFGTFFLLPWTSKCRALSLW